MDVPFNKPYLTGNEITFVKDAFEKRKFSGNGYYTKQCQNFFEEKYGFNKCLLTTSCTDALEMCAILLDIQPGDEIILPSFTFVSTANAFLLRGAKLQFADSKPNHPNIDPEEVRGLINSKTKAIIVVHYAGIACDMDEICDIANKNDLFIIEDAAQAIDSYWNEKPLGSIGHLATFSFHETKNISSGEGGMLVINDRRFEKRAEIIWEKGTNRAAFWRGEVDKYNWVDIGSSFLPSEITAAFLYAQLKDLEEIQQKRIEIWESYYRAFEELEKSDQVFRPSVPQYASVNGHIFYLICRSHNERNGLIHHLKENDIFAVFHYLSLHESPFYKEHYSGDVLKNSIKFSDCLVRLPFFFQLSKGHQKKVIEKVYEFYSP